jgi:hypothetical protein
MDDGRIARSASTLKINRKKTWRFARCVTPSAGKRAESVDSVDQRPESARLCVTAGRIYRRHKYLRGTCFGGESGNPDSPASDPRSGSPGPTVRLGIQVLLRQRLANEQTICISSESRLKDGCRLKARSTICPSYFADTPLATPRVFYSGVMIASCLGMLSSIDVVTPRC